MLVRADPLKGGFGSPLEEAPTSDSEFSLLHSADRFLQTLARIRSDVASSMQRALSAGRFAKQAAVNSLVWLAESAREEPINPQRCTLIFIPGFLGPAGSLRHIALTGREQGFNVHIVGVNLHLQSITTNAELALQEVQKLIEKIHRLKNGDPIPAHILMLVGFSMGGLVVKKMLSLNPLQEHVATVVLLGTPNNGSRLARLFPFLPSCREASDETFIHALNQHVDERYVAVSAGHDEVVPRTSSTLNGDTDGKGRNIVLEEAEGHLALTEDPLVTRRFYDLLRQTSHEEKMRRGIAT